MNPSLRTRLLLWLLIPLGAASVLSVWFNFRDARGTATRVQDRLLLGSARSIAQQIQYEDGTLEVAIPPAALELFHSADQDQVFYRIASARGLLLSGYAELPPPPGPVRPEESLAFDAVVRDLPVRVVAYAQPVFGAPAESPVVIEVAQTLRGRQALVRQMWLAGLREQVWMLALVVVLAWIALRRGLKTIVRLRDQVLERTPGSLEPLDPGPVPSELQPLVAALNGYVQRLDSQMAARGRFIANASHQLRTPLAVLHTQADYGLRSADGAEKDAALRGILDGVRDGTRTVNQLLSLSAAEAVAQHPRPRTRVDLVELVQRILEEQAALAQAKDIDLGFESPEAQVELLTSPGLLRELAANLVDNALRYTPPGGVVTVSVLRDAERVVLRVEDNGPGIPAEDRARVFERFSRLRPGDSQGCGLGLAIVQELAAALDAQVKLEDPERGSGLVVTVTCQSPQPIIQR